MPSFDSATYLRGLGWSGPGSSLNNDPKGRAKPVTVAQKKTLSGVGRDRDTAFPWWEMVFSSVAGKVGGGKVEHHRTSTGILSHRPPPATKTAYDSLPKPERSGGLNMDAMAMAKLEMARRQLYSGFLRGTKLTGSVEDEDEEVSAKGRGKRSRSDEDSSASESEGEKNSRKEKKSKRTKEEKEEKRRRKEEKRAKKEAKRKGKGKASDESIPPNVNDIAMAPVEILTTTTTISTFPSSTVETLSKAERKAARKLAKSLATTSSAASTAPTTPTLTSSRENSGDVAFEEDEEERAYREMKEALRKAEKRERKEAKRALKDK